MNCKPGDLAVIVREEAHFPGGDIGKFVEIIQPGEDWAGVGDSRFHWEVVGLSSMWVEDDDGLRIAPAGELVDVPDASLRPIRDNPGADETLTWAPVPAIREGETA